MVSGWDEGGGTENIFVQCTVPFTVYTYTGITGKDKQCLANKSHAQIG